MWNELKGGCAVLFGVIVLALIFALVWQVTSAINEARPETRALRAEQAQHEAAMNRIREEKAANAAAVTAAFAKGILDAAVVGARIVLAGIPLAALAVGLMLAVSHFAHQRQFVEVEGVPVARQLAMQGATVPMALMQVELHGQAAIEAARNPRLDVPRDLRHLSVRYGNQAAPRPRLEAPPTVPQLPTPAETPAVAVPTWEQVNAAGLLANPRGWLVGFAPDGQAVRSPGWDAWVHMAIAGLSRSGKSNTARLILAQAAQRGMRLVVLDPHAAHPDGVGYGLEAWPSLVLPIAATSQAMQEHALEIERWLSSGCVAQPTVVVIDEWTRLLDGQLSAAARESVARMARAVATSGAKFGLHLMVIGQGWTVDAASHVRDHLQIAYLHKLRPDQARLVTNAKPPAVESLPTGQAMVWLDGEWQRVGMPRISGEAMRSVTSRPIIGGASDSRAWATAQPVAQPTTATAEPPGVSAAPATATDNRARIAALAALGWARNAISLEVFGHKDGGTMDEITQVLGPYQSREEDTRMGRFYVEEAPDA
mgnify:CR=1 FL=1